MLIPSAFEAEIYSYSMSKGLFAGISIEGASLSMDEDANALFYRSFDLSPDDILTRNRIRAPRVAERIRKIVTKYAR